MKNIFIIRHALSEANNGGRTKTASDIPLHSIGIDQAHAFADSIIEQPDLIITSSFLRTQQTAEPLMKKFPECKTIVLDIHEFTYLDRNVYNDTTPEERIGAIEAYFEKCDPFYRGGLEEETFYELMLRAEKFKNDVEVLDAQNIYVFSHGNFMRALRLVSKVSLPINGLSELQLKELMSEFTQMRNDFDINNIQKFSLEKLCMQ